MLKMMRIINWKTTPMSSVTRVDAFQTSLTLNVAPLLYFLLLQYFVEKNNNSESF